MVQFNKEKQMDAKRKKLRAVFYCTDSGNEPVREWLKALTKTDKKMIGEDIKTVQFGWPLGMPLGMPLVRSLGDGLWEIRIKLSERRIARIIFFMDDNSMVLVTGFIKKSQKTSKTELDLAIKRKRQYERN